MKPFTQKDFEERQKALSRQDANSDLEHARHTLLFSCAKIAAILARGLERGKPDEYVMKLNRALRSVYFDKEENPAVWPTGFEPAADFNIRPTLIALENRAREIQREKMGKPCPDCHGDGKVKCPECQCAWAMLVTFPPLNKKRRKPAPVIKGQVIEHLLTDEKGESVNCELCKNHRIIDCPTCKGKGRV